MTPCIQYAAKKSRRGFLGLDNFLSPQMRRSNMIDPAFLGAFPMQAAEYIDAATGSFLASAHRTGLPSSTVAGRRHDPLMLTI